MKCYDCPRNCGVDRKNQKGFCGEGDKIRVAKVIENFKWEEPCISGEKGALAIFFSGCNLKCTFCQNMKISHGGYGKEFSSQEFAKFLRSFNFEKFSSIDLITPTHFTSQIVEALKNFNSPIPIVWNSSGYEKEDSIEKVATVVDVFLPDFKYCDESLSRQKSQAIDYFAVATKAIEKMRQCKPNNIFNAEGVLQKGVLIRHLVLPGRVKDSIAVLNQIKDKIQHPFVSIMSQYIPLGENGGRKIYPLEYKIVTSHAQKIGLNNGYFQEMGSADENFIPDF